MKSVASASEHLSGIDDLDRAIVNLSARINAATYELLVLIRRFDERAGWMKWGFLNCADWLHWRCDLSVGAAREKVRVAHALKALPATAEAFRRGTLSYSKVRALVRVVRRDNEDELLAFALKTTAARVEERCRELRCGTVASVAESNRAYAKRSLTLRRDPERGTMCLTVELPIEAGELIDKALDRARDDNAGPEFAEESWSARQADALVAIARSYLAGGSGESSGIAESYQVTVHVDQAALTDGQGRSGLPLESVKRIACDSDKVVIRENAEGEPLSVGRKTRIVPTNIKRALLSRDKCCVFPGCRNKRFVDAHHIQHWSAGGETSLENLMLLCNRHHRLVHEGGYSIEKDYVDRWMFKRPDGIAVPSCGYRPEDTVDDDADLSETINGVRDSAESYLTGRSNSLPMSILPPEANRLTWWDQPTGRQSGYPSGREAS
ncbi:MAG: DUF222 domain-containing protein [Woeseiaceae bacterium]